mmetsp:Transcript_38651/g.124025  ORF Transcript_38651/g.124025 Transcript_38651/m.124025 type:complete len:253 (-) Transcript_38651:736-1494(-)
MRRCISSYSAGVSGRECQVRNAFIDPITAGWPANVPITYATRAAFFGSERVIASLPPQSTPTGSPPPSVLPYTTKSACTPYACCAPRGATRKPVYTSSKMSSTPASVHVLRSLWSHSLYPGVGPTLRLFDCSTRSEGGDELRWKHWSGLTSTAAISLPRARITASESAFMSLRQSTSSGVRSLPAVGCIPSHQPWYAPPKLTTSGLRWLKRAQRTAAMTASVPDMWKDTSGRPEICWIILMFARVVSSSEPR